MLLHVCATPVAAQTPGQPDPLFASNDILQARMSGPLRQLIDEKSKEDYLRGTFSVVDENGAMLEFDLKFRARGNFRHENCDYPPVRLNFKKSQTKGTLLDKQDKLKLVIHCNRRAEYHQIVLQEYLAYRVLNLLTDKSLRVRLLQIVYADPSEEFESDPRYAFLIEHKNRAAKRIGSKEFVTTRAQVGLLEQEQLNLTSVFQFFIGNTDFSPIAGPPGDNCCHNYILFKNADTNITPIPYDFDQSGFVDAPYAEANPRFRLRSVKQRRYRGRCLNNEFVPASIQKLQDNKDQIYALINEQVGFEEDTRQQLLKFVGAFYELVGDPKRVERTILKKCI
jgi:hypothetical protein